MKVIAAGQYWDQLNRKNDTIYKKNSNDNNGKSFKEYLQISCKQINQINTRNNKKGIV